MRILHVTPYSPLAWAYGGIPRLTGALTRALARRGHAVTICTTDVCDATRRLNGELSASSSHAEPIEWRVFPNVSNRLAYHWQAFTPIGLSTYLARAAGSFDVAHLHACRNLPVSLAAHHLRKARVPYILAPNGTAPRLERRFFAKRVYDALAGDRDLAGAARLLAVSDAERRQLVDLGLPASSIRVIPNAVDLDEFSPPIVHGRFRDAHRLGDAPIVLFLGKQTPRKRVDVLVRAFAVLEQPHARLVIAGNDMGSAAGVRSLARELGIAGRTTFTGLLAGRERLEALADADVVVHPAEDEVFGLAPLEALLTGTPVIVSGDSGCAEVVRSTGGGQIVPAGDFRAVTAAIARVLEAPVAWRKAAAAGAARARTLYGGDAVAAAVADLYQDVALRWAFTGG